MRVCVRIAETGTSALPVSSRLPCITFRIAIASTKRLPGAGWCHQRSYFTTGSAEKIPASLRFRAGGTDSIRGYGFQSIGTRKGASVLPAKYLGTASLEYQYWFKPDWGAAVFWDTGTATDNLDGVKLYHGVGVGARWRSPVGPVQLDVGYGIQDRKIRPHISLGVAF